MNYKSINNITGWIIFLIATTVYVMTIEPTASYWDCGEFISSSYKLMVPHPPGAPFFLLIGRLFSLFASDAEHIAYMVNLVSALSSSFTSLFLFWSITILAKRMVVEEGKEISIAQTITIMGAGIIGSLAYTFTDSAWFNAVEAEVYAMSSFFTAFVFWAILKWEQNSEKVSSDKWIILIAYMMGLSIGVHLLNLLAIFALAFVIYFKKYDITLKGVLITLGISAAVILGILEGIIPGLPTLAGKMEVLFVNSFGLPFGSGIIFFVLLFVGVLIYAIYYSVTSGKRILNTALLALSFILIGYSSYVIIVIRSAYETTIDMNDPGDIMNFVSYLKREQYGDRPLFFGPNFTAPRPTAKQGAPVYRKGKKKYEIYDHKQELTYNPKHVTALPRMYSTQPHHVRAYRSKMNLPARKIPSLWDNIRFMFKHQIGHMYLRYFGWNFIGRQSDIQDAHILWPTETGEKDLPHIVETNKARNNFFMLPFLAGIAGLVYQFSRKRNDGIIVGLLFFFTGLAIVLYLNQPPIEPRERDYTFAGSFWAFSIWIGLAVLWLAEVFEKLIKNRLAAGAIATLLLLVVPGILVAEGWDDHNRSNRYHSVDSAKNLLNSCAPNAILFTGGDNDTYPLWYVQEVEGFRTDVRVCNLSLLNTDWYIAQMKRRSYKSAPLPISLPIEKYLQGTNDGVAVMQSGKTINLQEFIKLVKINSPEVIFQAQSGEKITYLPGEILTLDIDKAKLQNSNFIPEKYKPFLLDKLTWTVTKDEYIDKKSLVILDILATNNWERPIYFANTISGSEFMNLQPFTQLEGMAYRLLPVKVPTATADGFVNTDIMYDNMMHKFYWRGLDDPKVYYNEWYYSFTTAERQQFLILAEELYREGEKEKAKEVLLKSLKVMPDNALPYDEAVASYVPLLFKLGEDAKAEEIIKTMTPRFENSVAYVEKSGDFRELRKNIIAIQKFMEAYRNAGKEKEALSLEPIYEKYGKIYNEFFQGS